MISQEVAHNRLQGFSTSASLTQIKSLIIPTNIPYIPDEW